MPKVSVIVPVYNVEKYVEKCVASILDQTEKDYELLLVDDGSTDNSGKLCDSLAETDSRIRVIHQKNQGLGGARNTGIREAAGEWILLVDSDDWIDPDILEKTLAVGERENADMVIFAYRTVDEAGKEMAIYREDIPKNRVLSTETCPEALLTAPCAWNKLYRTSLFRETGLEYPGRVWYEDIRTTPKLMAHAKRMVFIDDVGYNYLQRQGSIMKSGNIARNQEILDAFDDILDWFQAQGLFSKYCRELEYLAVFHAYLTASVRVLMTDQKHPLLDKFSSYLREHFPGWKKNPYLKRLGKKRQMLLFLLARKQYGAITLLFKLKG
jgi:glycosyltransferase involved in cell wall biosynthesis